MDDLKIRDKATRARDLIEKIGGPEGEGETNQMELVSIGIELLANLLVDINRIANAIEQQAANDEARLTRELHP